jgi:hypothetical protein
MLITGEWEAMGKGQAGDSKRHTQRITLQVLLGGPAYSMMATGHLILALQVKV